jgi:hypothetical protein
MKLHPDFLSWAEQLAAQLPGWTLRAEAEYYSCRLERGDHGALVLVPRSKHYNGVPDRCEVYGTYPADGTRTMAPRDWGVLPYGTPAPTATVSLARPIAQAARDITRRVIEPYRPLWLACVERKREREAQRSQALHHLEQVVAALGPAASIDSHAGPDDRTIRLYNGSIWGQISRGRMELHHLPATLVLEIARLIGRAIAPDQQLTLEVAA